MRIAVPVLEHPDLGDQVAPRFCFAEQAWLVEVEEGRETRWERLDLGPPSFPARIELLARLRVTDLLAGGFNRRYRPMAEGAGIRVHWGWRGSPEEAIRAWLAGEPAPFPRGAGRGRGWRRRWRGGFPDV